MARDLNRIVVSLDEDLQIIRQKIIGGIDEEDSRAISNLTAAEATRLADPSRVRICLDGREIGPMKSRARKILMGNLKRDDIVGLAVWGANAYSRAVINFVHFLEGGRKIRAFGSEDEAVRWLKEL